MLPMIRRLQTLVLLLCFAAIPAAAWQETPAETAAVEEPTAGDPLNRETPLSSMMGFVEAAEAFEWDIAAQYLDLRNLPEEVRQMEGATLAEMMYFILQRREVEINDDYISNRADGHPIDDLPEYRDLLARVSTSDGEKSLLLQRVPGPEGEFIWKVSNVTVAAIPSLYEEFRLPEWVEGLRDSLPTHQSFLGIELFKWIIILGYALVITPILWLLAWGLTRLISRPDRPLYPEIRSILTGPVVGLAVLFLLSDLVHELGVGAFAASWMKAYTLFTAFMLWLIWDIVNLWRARRRVRYEAEGRKDAAVLGRPVANAIKLITLVIGLLVWLANAGVDISALLAGLGIGGIAVALALQKPIEDLFGAISIYSQQPVNTGDLCRYGTEVGKVEEIGLRTTRIRTLANSLVSVPNSHFSTGVIENLTARTKILYQADLPIRYDTNREKLERLLEGLEQIARDNPQIEDETIRIRLKEFAAHAVIVRMRLFALTRDFDEYMKIISDLNLDIMELMDSLEARFSQGAQTLFIKDGDGSSLKPRTQAS